MINWQLLPPVNCYLKAVTGTHGNSNLMAREEIETAEAPAGCPPRRAAEGPSPSGRTTPRGWRPPPPPRDPGAGGAGRANDATRASKKICVKIMSCRRGAKVMAMVVITGSLQICNQLD